MGCYGIGVNRCIAAVIEQNCDEKGIVWPMSLAPYHVIIVPVNTKDESQVELAEKLYSQFTEAGVETLIDDRNERAGVKFKDAELIGIPIRITVGKKAADGIVEFGIRKSGESEDVAASEALDRALKIINA